MEEIYNRVHFDEELKRYFYACDVHAYVVSSEDEWSVDIKADDHEEKYHAVKRES